MKKTTRILLITAAILAIGLLACGCVRNRKEDEIDFSPIENQQSSSSELNSSESSSSSEENSSVPTESTSSSSEESSVPDSKPVDEPPVSSSSSSSSKPASNSSSKPVYTERPVGSTSEDSSSKPSSAPAPGYNIYGEKSNGKWVEMPGGTFWEEEDGFYYSYEDWVNGKSPVPYSIVEGQNIEDYDGPIIEWN